MMVLAHGRGLQRTASISDHANRGGAQTTGAVTRVMVHRALLGVILATSLKGAVMETLVSTGGGRPGVTSASVSSVH